MKGLLFGRKESLQNVVGSQGENIPDFWWALNPMIIILLRGGEDTEAQKEGYMKTGGDWGSMSTSPAMPRIASSHHKLGEAWNGFSLRLPRRNQSCQHFNF